MRNNTKIYFRLFLAALHFNENSARQQSRTKEGDKQYVVSYPKGRGGEGVANEVKVDQTFSEYVNIYIIKKKTFSSSNYNCNSIHLHYLDYIADLMDAVVELRMLNDSYSKARNVMEHGVQIPPPIAQSTPKPPKNVTIQRHTTRFN